MSLEDSSLDQLEKRLYRRASDQPKAFERMSLGREIENNATDFALPGSVSPESLPEHAISPMLLTAQKLFRAAGLFFIAALVFALVYRGGAGSQVSSRNIDIVLSGPVSVKGGEELVLQATITNNNSTALQLADLVIEYPEGTRSPERKDLALSRVRESLGEVSPGASITKTVRAVLFGEEGSTKEIRLGVEYRTEGSNAIFDAYKTYQVALNASPVTLRFEVPADIISGTPVELRVGILANASSPIPDAALSLVYPPGFSVTATSPEADARQSFWRIGALTPGKEKVIVIKGVLLGEENDAKSFRAVVGSPVGPDIDKIGTPFGESFRAVTLRRPYVGFTMRTNGADTETVTVAPDELIDFTSEIQNSFSLPIRDVEIALKISGGAFDKASVRFVGENQGYYRSQDQTILWSKDTTKTLSELAPGEDFSGLFQMNGIPGIATGKIVNPQIAIEGVVSAIRSDDPSGDRISATLSRLIKFRTAFSVSSSLLREDGPFTNTGPFPPRADQESDYTVRLAIANSTSDAAGAVVRTVLPLGVKWKGVYLPDSESVSYDADTREVVWSPGEIKAGVGVVRPPRELFFQISSIPSQSSIGDSLKLVSSITFRAVDLFTNSRLEGIKGALATSVVQK